MPDYQQMILYFIIYVACGALFWLSDGFTSIIIFGATALVQMTVTVVYSPSRTAPMPTVRVIF